MSAARQSTTLNNYLYSWRATEGQSGLRIEEMWNTVQFPSTLHGSQHPSLSNLSLPPPLTIRWTESRCNITQWARDNNLKTNPAQFAEIVFVDNRKKNKAHPPPPLPGIVRVTKNPRSHLYEQSLCRWACSRCYQFQRANSVCPQSLARPRHGRHLTADNFPLGRHSQANVCL